MPQEILKQLINKPEGINRSLKPEGKFKIVIGHHTQYMTVSDAIKTIPEDRLIFYKLGDD